MDHVERLAQAAWAALLLVVCLVRPHESGTPPIPCFYWPTPTDTHPKTQPQGTLVAAAPSGQQSGPGLPRRMAGTGKGLQSVGGAVGGVGFDRQRTLGFVEYLSLETLDSIDTFDRLSVGLNMTIEDFFTFINRLLEEEVPDKRCVRLTVWCVDPFLSCMATPTQLDPPFTITRTPRAEDDWEDEDTLTVEQLGQLFGGVNETAVDYILDAVGATVEDLQAGFNTVDVIMVLMYVSSHLEANGVQVSILDIITGFCDREWEVLDADVWVPNVAKAKGVPEARLKRLMNQLEGSLEDIRGYVEEIVRPDACDLIVNGGFPSLSGKVSSRFGHLRGKNMGSSRGQDPWEKWEKKWEQRQPEEGEEDEEGGLMAVQRRASAAVAGAL